MADFAPPSGPPPPKVPQGWKAIWNAQYSEWFFVNIYTKQSQWDKPESPAYPPGEGPHGGPPSYAAPASGGPQTDKSSYGSNNPYTNTSEDEKLARRLQEEEQSRAGGHPGAANDFYTQPGQGYPQQGYAPQGTASSSYPPSGQTEHADSSAGGKAKGLIGKLLGAKHGASSSSHAPYVQQPHGYGGQAAYGAPAGYYGAAQPMGYGRPVRKQGMGAGGMALGVGGGLLGGALLGSALGDAGDGGDGGGFGGDGGGFGGDGGGFGGDGGGFGGDGGGDFGGGDGGGDFGGGDFGGGD